MGRREPRGSTALTTGRRPLASPASKVGAVADRSRPRATFAVRVQPRSSRRSLRWDSARGVVVVHLSAAPVEGQANRECLRVLAEALGVPPSRLRIVRGERAREKTVAVDGLDQPEIDARLRRLAAAAD